jgi:autoinducer 2-degrading protein
MIVTLVHVWVKENFVEEFIKVTIENHIQSVKESGNLRFDILQDAENPAKFVLYEAYESEAAAAAHKETNHYLKWRNTVADWMMQPRQGVRHNIIYPIDARSW